MEQTAYLSATTMDTRKRRVVVIAVLFAWLALLLTCPVVTDEMSNTVPAGDEHISHAATDSTHGNPHDDICCTAAQHTVVLATVHNLKFTAYFILTFVLPVIVTSLTALVVTVSSRDFIRSSRSGWTKSSPLFCTLWPQAPPR